MRTSLQVLNQIFELQQKINNGPDAASFERNFSRLFDIFEEDGFVIQNPINEMYNESRTDYEASIIGEAGKKMKISRVLKPIIYQKSDQQLQLVQKAIVMVEKI